MNVSETQLSHRIYTQIRDERAALAETRSLASNRVDETVANLSQPNGAFSRMNDRQKEEVAQLAETASVFADALAKINQSEHLSVLSSSDSAFASNVRDVHFQAEGRDQIRPNMLLPRLIENALEANEIKTLMRLDGLSDPIDVDAMTHTVTKLRTAVEDRIVERMNQIGNSTNAVHRIED